MDFRSLVVLGGSSSLLRDGTHRPSVFGVVLATGPPPSPNVACLLKAVSCDIFKPELSGLATYCAALT